MAAVTTTLTLPHIAVRPNAPYSRRREPKPQPAINDLRGYLEHTYLSTIRRYDMNHSYSLPPRGDRSTRPGVTIRADPKRKIRHIRKYDKHSFDKVVKKWHKKRIYDVERGRPFLSKNWTSRPSYEGLSLPAHNYLQEVPHATNIPYPSSVDETALWLESPFKTMQRAVHLAYPTTRRWWLDETTNASDVGNRLKWKSYVWRFHPDEIQDVWWRATKGNPGPGEPLMEPSPHESMTVIVQPPYTLAWQDFINVADVRKISNVSPTGARRKRVWAKIVDTCRQYGTHWFAITTYEGWLFGKFTEDWSSVHHSGVRDHSDADPNVIQTFVYWVAASIGLDGTGKMIPVVDPSPIPAPHHRAPQGVAPGPPVAGPSRLS